MCHSWVDAIKGTDKTHPVFIHGTSAKLTTGMATLASVARASHTLRANILKTGRHTVNVTDLFGRRSARLSGSRSTGYNVRIDRAGLYVVKVVSDNGSYAKVVSTMN